MNKTIPTLAFAALVLAGCGPQSAMGPYTKDGTYQADGAYTSPGGPESITLKLTVSKGVISDVVVTPHATLPKSIQYQGEFAAGIKDLVVGKKISDLNITKVAGSSLTSGGFNDALKKIEAQM